MEVAQLLGLVAPKVVQSSPFKKLDISAKFKPAYRLLRKDGFGHVMHAEQVTDKYFKIFFVQNSRNNARLGIIASKKTLPGAVDRNRAKRIIRETFRQHKVKTGKADIVVMMKRASAQNLDGWSNELKMLFSRVEDRCANF